MRRPTPMGAHAVKLTVEVARRSYIPRSTPSRPPVSPPTSLDSMAEIPLRRASRSRRLLVRLVWAAWAVAIVATALGFTAAWLAVFDLINQARPVQVVGALALFAAAIALRARPPVRPAAARAVLPLPLP